MRGVVRWRPFMDLDRFFDEDVAHGLSSPSGFTPAIDVYQTKDNVVVEAPLPGIDPTKVNVAIENDVLTIEGSMEQQSEVDDKDYYRKEVRTGSFHRAVALPAAVKSNAAKADYENGILKVTVPKEERAKPTSVRVNVKKGTK